MGMKFTAVLFVLVGFSLAGLADETSGHAPEAADGHSSGASVSANKLEVAIPRGLINKFPEDRRSDLEEAFRNAMSDATWVPEGAVNPEAAKNAVTPENALRNFVNKVMEADPSLSDQAIYQDIFNYLREALKAAAEKDKKDPRAAGYFRKTPWRSNLSQKVEIAAKIAQMRSKSTPELEREVALMDRDREPVRYRVGRAELARRKLGALVKRTKVSASLSEIDALSKELGLLADDERGVLLNKLEEKPGALATLLKAVNSPDYREQLKRMTDNPITMPQQLKDLVALTKYLPPSSVRTALEHIGNPYTEAVTTGGIYNAPAVMNTVADYVNRMNAIDPSYRPAENITVDGKESAMFLDRFGRPFIVEGHPYSWYHQKITSPDQRERDEGKRALRMVTQAPDGRFTGTQKFDRDENGRMVFKAERPRDSIGSDVRQLAQSSYDPNSGTKYDEGETLYSWVGNDPNSGAYWKYKGKVGSNNDELKRDSHAAENWSVVLPATSTQPGKVLNLYGTAKSRDGRTSYWVYTTSDGKTTVLQQTDGSFNSGTIFHSEAGQDVYKTIDQSTLTQRVHIYN
jgi:hypothetical protein